MYPSPIVVFISENMLPTVMRGLHIFLTFRGHHASEVFNQVFVTSITVLFLPRTYFAATFHNFVGTPKMLAFLYVCFDNQRRFPQEQTDRAVFVFRLPSPTWDPAAGEELCAPQTSRSWGDGFVETRGK